MSINLTFDGTTECRGRNGWFQLRTAAVSQWQHDASCCAYFYSGKTGNMPPIVLHFHNPEELRTLICGLAKALAQMTTITEEPEHWSSANGCHDDCPACKENAHA